MPITYVLWTAHADTVDGTAAALAVVAAAGAATDEEDGAVLLESWAETEVAAKAIKTPAMATFIILLLKLM